MSVPIPPLNLDLTTTSEAHGGDFGSVSSAPVSFGKDSIFDNVEKAALVASLLVSLIVLYGALE